MNNDKKTLTSEQITELAEKVLKVEKSLRTEQSKGRTQTVNQILNLLNEVVKNDN